MGGRSRGPIVHQNKYKSSQNTEPERQCSKRLSPKPPKTRAEPRANIVCEDLFTAMSQIAPQLTIDLIRRPHFSIFGREHSPSIWTPHLSRLGPDGAARRPPHRARAPAGHGARHRAASTPSVARPHPPPMPRPRAALARPASFSPPLPGTTSQAPAPNLQRPRSRARTNHHASALPLPAGSHKSPRPRLQRLTQHSQDSSKLTPDGRVCGPHANPTSTAFARLLGRVRDRAMRSRML